MTAKRLAPAAATCPFSPVNRGQIDRWIEDATKTPPQLFKKYRFDRRDLVKLLGGDNGALVVEHVCEVFQLWSDGHDARMRRLQYAAYSRGPISAEGEFSRVEPSGKAGKRTSQTVVAIVDFLVPVLLALGVPWGATTSAKMTRALDLVAVDLFRLPGTKSELQKRQRDERAKRAVQRAALVMFEAHRASFVGPPKPPELRSAERSAAWRGLSPAQRTAIREAVLRGLSPFESQPPQDIRPSH
jgi:hypothetical protein